MFIKMAMNYSHSSTHLLAMGCYQSSHQEVASSKPDNIRLTREELSRDISHQMVMKVIGGPLWAEWRALLTPCSSPRQK